MTNKSPVRLAVVGAGLIGKRHAEHVAREDAAVLSVVVDPSDVGRDLAARLGAKWHRSIADMIRDDRPEGVIIATPNQMHVVNGLEVIDVGIPAIVEKPLADDLAGAEKLVRTADAKHVPLLVGHHRRYNPMIAKAKEILDAGWLGRVLTLHGQFWLMKPDDYFDIAWRREKGAGPILLNLIHDIDLFRYLCGEVVAVNAASSNAVRGHAVEETAVILLQFASGVLGTVNVSDSVVGPWSWEQTTGENPAYPRQDQSCYQIGGTHGSLSIPQLEVWSNRDVRSWLEPLQRERVPFTPEDPLSLQVRHFCDVIRNGAQPIASGREGLATLQVIDAVERSARTGQQIRLPGIGLS
ncbi:Gfo/Idh/MocA family oxidoreductase [Terrarubrum flagellatum]|uniref:Gfo/Idh/MocA family protein n=1 Tax=Terrirubrum flagellatum TaxID=2895980 RepID=UPI0031451FCC